MLQLKLVNIGFGNSIILDKVVGIVAPESLPIKRMVSWMKENRPNDVIDATYGHKTRALITTVNGQLYICAIHPSTLAQRLVDTYGKE